VAPRQAGVWLSVDCSHVLRHRCFAAGDLYQSARTPAPATQPFLAFYGSRAADKTTWRHAAAIAAIPTTSVNVDRGESGGASSLCTVDGINMTQRSFQPLLRHYGSFIDRPLVPDRMPVLCFWTCSRFTHSFLRHSRQALHSYLPTTFTPALPATPRAAATSTAGRCEHLTQCSCPTTINVCRSSRGKHLCRA